MITSKLGDAIGLEINDLDVTKISDKETINTITDLLSEFSVVVIRNQNITDDDHIKFSENFGTLELTKVGTDGSGSKLIILRNFDENGNIDIWIYSRQTRRDSRDSRWRIHYNQKNLLWFKSAKNKGNL